jgi:hypothetical protein
LILHSAKELAHFERIRNQFEQQDVSSKAKETRPTNEAPRLTTWSSLPVRQRDSPQVVQKPASNMDHNIAVRGKGKGKAIANPDSGPEGSGDSDGAYPRTRMPNGASNGVGENGKGKGRGKSKGKGKAPTMGRSVDTEEEDLYS